MQRRIAGEGSLYYRADKGLWVAQHSGVYRSSKDKDKAQAKLDDLLNGGSDEANRERTTVSALLDQWLEFSIPNLKPATIKRYKEVIRLHINPAMGRRKVSSLTPYDVQRQYSGWLSQGISPNTIYACHTVLSGAFRRAAKWQLVGTNIIRDVDAPKLPQTEIEVFEHREVRAILSAAKGTRYEAAVILALSCGMRGGEIFSTQPGDYNRQAGTLAIRRTLVNNGTAIGTPKSKNSKRTIQLPTIARDALDRTDRTKEWMFPSRAGTTLFYHNWIRLHWRPLLGGAGVEYRNFHVCRHYVCSTLLASGQPIPSIAKFLGDTEQTILRTYNHLMPNQMQEVAAAMDAALS
jgi:integrase